jgi:hypothetical protein
MKCHFPARISFARLNLVNRQFFSALKKIKPAGFLSAHGEKFDLKKFKAW